jgi:homoserine O-acetyltransferase
MRMNRFAPITALAVALLLPHAAAAADYPTPREADWVARDFRFHTGAVMPEMRVHYTTIGDPAGEPVLVLHGTGGSGTGLLSPTFAGELFGPGQALDARKYFIILPDAIGTGQSSKPSDGLRAQFPAYDYDDMVQAQYRLLTEGLGLRHLRLVLGNSMGGMEAWAWGVAHPDFMDALVPMASQPTPMAQRNWMLRRMLIEAVRADPAYNGGNYTAQPPSLRAVNILFDVATNGGTLNLSARGATHAGADKYVDERLAAPPPRDANDYIFQWGASADFDPTEGLGRIEAPVLAINSADDERNPPETGVMARAMAKLPHGRLLLIPASTETRGHGTTGFARFWAAEVAAFLQAAPHRTEAAQTAKR